MIPVAQPTLRGIAIGLWVLAGLTFLFGALLPGAGNVELLAPALLAAAIVWTVLIPRAEQPTRNTHPRWLLLAGVLLAFAISFTLINAGDRRSLLFGGFATLAVFLFSHSKRPASKT